MLDISLDAADLFVKTTIYIIHPCYRHFVDQHCWPTGAPTRHTRRCTCLVGYSQIRACRPSNLASHVTWPTASGRTSVCADGGLNTRRSMKMRNISTLASACLPFPSPPPPLLTLYFSFGVSAALHWLMASAPPSP